MTYIFVVKNRRANVLYPRTNLVKGIVLSGFANKDLKFYALTKKEAMEQIALEML